MDQLVEYLKKSYVETGQSLEFLQLKIDTYQLPFLEKHYREALKKMESNKLLNIEHRSEAVFRMAILSISTSRKSTKMASNSKIEWTESTWNPITGCNKVSPGCKYCYAERFAKRLQAMGQPNYRNGFELTLQKHVLEYPLSWKKPQMIFVNSMSDLFHKDVPLEFIQKIFEVMQRAHWHVFQVLTKRSERLLELHQHLPWSNNIWMGVSVENNDYTFRIDHLSKTDAKIKFLSLEPLLGPLPVLNLSNIDWVIVGGESGSKSRPIKTEWIIEIKEQCLQAAVPFFFKQWGGKNKKKNGRLLEGETWDELPYSDHPVFQREAI